MPSTGPHPPPGLGHLRQSFAAPPTTATVASQDHAVSTSGPGLPLSAGRAGVDVGASSKP